MRDVVSELFIVLLIEFDFKVYSIFCMVFPQTNNLRVAFIHYFVKVFLVVFCPLSNGKLLDMDDAISVFVEFYYTLDFIF